MIDSTDYSNFTTADNIHGFSITTNPPAAPVAPVVCPTCHRCPTCGTQTPRLYLKAQFPKHVPDGDYFFV